MKERRVLAIGLDGYEPSFAAQLMEAGKLPALARLRDRSARFFLDHGPAQRTGLAWEHVSTGLSPEASRRWGAVTFDPATYSVWQEGTSLTPFAARVKAPTVVFDAPYFDLEQARNVQGIVAWGAHDPGTPAGSRPSSLLRELKLKFGAYPAEDWIYGFTWQSAERSRRMGDALARATFVRSEAAQWLLAERLPDWRLALVVVSELHSASEALWHGVDPTHPLHTLPSSRPAKGGMHAVYKAVDQLVSALVSRFPEATTVVFAMHGMGPNKSDIPGMVLLPELMFRHGFGRPLLEQPGPWSEAANGRPLLNENEDWHSSVPPLVPGRVPVQIVRSIARGKTRLKRFAPFLERLRLRRDSRRLSLRWIPATRYQQYWPMMRAFALPSFYDGRIRINMAGRELSGLVCRDRYDATCDEIKSALNSCLDPATGERLVDFIAGHGGDPLTLGPTEADLVVDWKGTPSALEHPVHGPDRPCTLSPHRWPHWSFRDGLREWAGHRGRRSRRAEFIRHCPHDYRTSWRTGSEWSQWPQLGRHSLRVRAIPETSTLFPVGTLHSSGTRARLVSCLLRG